MRRLLSINQFKTDSKMLFFGQNIRSKSSEIEIEKVKNKIWLQHCI